MKTYTFKIRRDFVDENNIQHHEVYVSIHCPFEVFYDSLRQAKVFEDIEDAYITISDYTTVFSRIDIDAETGEEKTFYDFVEHPNEVELSTVKALFESRDYISFMSDYMKDKE